MAKEKGLNYIGLDGTVGIIANGAGLAMSTLDVVNQVGGSAANFLDIGGGANADVMASALEVINTDPKVKVDLRQHLRRHHPRRRGRQRRPRGARARRRSRSPIVLRLDGTNAVEGRAILAPHLERPPDHRTDHARRRPPGRGPRERLRSAMSIFVDENTKVIVQGLTGGQGRFHGLRNRDYGTKVVGGRHPGQGRHRRRRHPGLQHGEGGRRGDRARRRPSSSCRRSSPPAAILEAAEGGITLHRLHHRGHPGPRRGGHLQPPGRGLPRRAPARAQLPGHHQPRQVQHRHHLGRHRAGRAGRSASSRARAR